MGGHRPPSVPHRLAPPPASHLTDGYVPARFSDRCAIFSGEEREDDPRELCRVRCAGRAALKNAETVRVLVTLVVRLICKRFIYSVC